MNTQEKEPVSARHRKNGIEEEQTLCNEALKTGELDEISDAAWVLMCEEAAAKARKPKAPPAE